MIAPRASRDHVWFAIPSACPENCCRNLPAWREMGYRVAVLQNRQRAEIPADIVVWSDMYPGWAESINILCRTIVPREALIVVSGGDDMLPEPGHGAPELAAQFLEHFAGSPGGTFGVMQPTGDGYLGARHFCGSPWLGRAFIETMYRARGPMFGGYQHNWADNELYWVARGLGALWERPDLTQRHMHFSRMGEAAPRYWQEHVQAADRDDVQLFIARSWQHFPGHEPAGVALRYDPQVLRRESRGLAESYWITRYGMGLLAETAERRFREALAGCAARGRTRVALYGAGTHTRGLAAALMRPAVPILCIIDDDPTRAGGRLWNYPIVPREEALRMDLEAIVLSSNGREEELWEAAEPLRQAGVEVIALYGGDGHRAPSGTK